MGRMVKFYQERCWSNGDLLGYHADISGLYGISMDFYINVRIRILNFAQLDASVDPLNSSSPSCRAMNKQMTERDAELDSLRSELQTMKARGRRLVHPTYPLVN